jgi:beta-galactosidase
MHKEYWNDGWKFWEEKDAFALVWTVPEDAESVTIPHDAMIAKTPRADSPNGKNTGFRDGGNYVYYKTLYAPQEWKDRTVELFFEGIYADSFVYVNGQPAGRNPNGYTGFRVPLDDFLRYGEDNEIRVSVRNGAMPNSRWYSGSGIYRDVQLRTAGRTYLPAGGLRIRTLQADADDAVLQIRSHDPESGSRRKTASDGHSSSGSFGHGDRAAGGKHLPVRRFGADP